MLVDNNSNKKYPKRIIGSVVSAGCGYEKVYLPNHPFCSVDGYVLKHRYIMEIYLSYKFKMPIYVLPCLDVHHINGIKNDNRVLNLIIKSHREHSLNNSFAKKDMSNRFCFQCGSKKTSLRKGGKYPRWYKHGDGYYCDKCYTNNKESQILRPRYFITK